MKSFGPHSTLAHYRIVAQLGAGGMGEVWLAEDTRLKRKVALKLLPTELTADAERVRRFEQEAQAASALSHPNIITVYDIGECEAGRFIVMELVAGRTLRSVLTEDNSLETVLSLGQQMAKALSAAHTAGITHRDIKPDNLMVRDDGYVKVLDFGLARLRPATESDSEAATLAQQTTPGTVMGTVAYMSPEQARGETVSHPSDIFALGIVLYELATGRHPFKAETLVGYLHAITLQEPPPPAQWKPELPAALNDLILQMLSKDASQRPTASEVAQALQNIERRGDTTRRSSSEGERALASDEAQTLMLKPTTTAATVAKDTAAENAQPTTPDKPKAQRRWLAVLLSLVALVGSFFGYRSFTATKPIESIAVMPFVNESGNAEVEYLSDGMTETLISSLSNLPNLSVKARSTVFYYKGKETAPQKIGADLKVQAVLLGRVSQRGNDLKLNLELVNTQTQDVIWSEQYNRKQADLVTLQSELARDVAGKLKTRLSGAEAAKVEKNYTTNAEAYQLYLKGKFYWNKRTGAALKQALEFYNQAIAKDPTYALAYSGLAETYGLFSSYDVAPATDSMPQAKAAALRALELDEQLAEAHTALGFYLANYEWDRVGSEREYRRAIELKPNYATAHHWFGTDLMNVKRFDDSLAELRQAEELDPLSPIIGTNLGDLLVHSRRYDEAIAQYRRVLVRDPNFAYAHRALGWAYGSKGMYPEAIAETRASMELREGSSAKGYWGLWLAKSGKRDEALKLLNELKQASARDYVQSYTFALIYVGLGEKEEALNYLEKHMLSHAETANTYNTAPELDGLRSEPRFKEMLKRMKLPE